MFPEKDLPGRVGLDCTAHSRFLRGCRKSESSVPDHLVQSQYGPGAKSCWNSHSLVYIPASVYDHGRPRALAYHLRT